MTTEVSIPDVTNLDSKQLAKLQETVKRQIQANLEATKQERITKLLQSNPDLVARWRAATAAAEKYRNRQKLKVKMLLQVEFEVEVTLDIHNFRNDIYDELFRVDVYGSVQKTKGLTSDQIIALNNGLSETLSNACDQKLDLFPTLQHELSGIAAELQDVQELLDKHDLSIIDLEKVAAPTQKKKKK